MVSVDFRPELETAEAAISNKICPRVPYSIPPTLTVPARSFSFCPILPSRFFFLPRDAMHARYMLWP